MAAGKKKHNRKMVENAMLRVIWFLGNIKLPTAIPMFSGLTLSMALTFIK